MKKKSFIKESKEPRDKWSRRSTLSWIQNQETNEAEDLHCLGYRTKRQMKQKIYIVLDTEPRDKWSRKSTLSWIQNQETNESEDIYIVLDTNRFIMIMKVFVCVVSSLIRITFKTGINYWLALHCSSTLDRNNIWVNHRLLYLKKRFSRDENS